MTKIYEVQHTMHNAQCTIQRKIVLLFFMIKASLILLSS